MHVNLEHAEKAIQAARKKAVELNTQMCIAVVDSGANLKAFMRMDDKPIDIKTQIYEPDAVVVLDPTLMEVVDVTDGLKKNGFLIVNSTKGPSEFKVKGGKVFTVDATKIAVSNRLGTETNPIVNTAILGAYSKAIGNVGMKAITEAIVENAPIKTTENKKAAQDAFEKTVGA